jgi:CBS-domain-containing membrane protein
VLSLLGLLSAWSGMVLRCLNPPAGGRAFLGMAPGTTPLLVLIPVLSGSMLLLLKAGYQPLLSRNSTAAQAMSVTGCCGIPPRLPTACLP